MIPAGIDIGDFQGKDLGTILLTAAGFLVVGVFTLGVKFGYWGFTVLGPYDRAVRERMGKPTKYFSKPGKVFYIKVFHWVRKANVAPQTMDIIVPVNKGGIGDLRARFVFQIIDQETMVRRAIYGLYDANRSDLQNDERVAYVQGVVESAVHALVSKKLAKKSSPTLTLKGVNKRCRSDMVSVCGTEVIDFGITSDAPSQAQVEASAKLEAAAVIADAINRVAPSWPVFPPDEELLTEAPPVIT